MKIFAAIWLYVVIAVSVAVMWVPARWPTTFAEVGVFAICAVWLLAFAVGRSSLRLPVVLFPLVGALGWCVAQIALGLTVYRWNTRVAALYWAGNLATVFIGVQCLNERARGVRFAGALAVFGSVVGVVSCLQTLTANGKIYWFFPLENGIERAFGPFVYSNQFAAFIELLLPVALYLAMTGGRRKFVWGAMAAVMYTSVLVTASRAGAVLTTGEVLLIPVLLRQAKMVRRGAAASVAGLVVVVAVILALAQGPMALIERFAAKDPYGGRREFVVSSLKMIETRPLTGTGLGNWATAYPAFAVFDDGLYVNQAHNDWAQWAVEGGIPFACLLLFVAVRSGYYGLRSIWGAGIVFLFCHCLVDYPIQRAPVALVLFAMIAAVEPSGPEIGRLAEKLRRDDQKILLSTPTSPMI